MPFRRYVEVGRVAMVNYGPEYGDLVVISDVVDHNRALVDHPNAKRRWVVNFKRLTLTDFKLEIPRLAKKEVLKKAVEDADLFTRFGKTTWGQKLAKRKARSEMTDLDRYRAMMARKKRSWAIRGAFKQICSDATEKAS